MIAGIILAAGFSARMGKNKLLLELNGLKLIEKVIEESSASALDEIILVYKDAEVKKAAKKYGIKTVFNPRAHLGQSTSFKLGIKEAPGDADFMFLMGDQPFVTDKIIDRLITAFKAGEKPIAVPYYNGQRGTPTIFSNELKNILLAVEGDKGGRDIIKSGEYPLEIVFIDDGYPGLDVDTPRDWEKCLAKLKMTKRNR